MRRAAIVLLGLLALSATLGPPLRADYRDAYKSGITDGLDRDNWAVLASSMREAIQQQPQASKKRIKLYGNRFSAYLPYYYLGLALYNQGDLEGALREWEIAASQGAAEAALKKGELRDWQERLSELRSRFPPGGEPAVVAETETPAEEPSEEPTAADAEAVQQAVRAAEKAVADAEQIASALGTLARDAALREVWDQEPALGPAKQRAESQLVEARRSIATAKAAGDVAALGAATVQASAARQALSDVREKARSRRQERLAEQEAAQAETRLAQARAAAARELDRAQQARETVRSLAADPLLSEIWTGDEQLGGRERQAQQLLDQAGQGLETAADAAALDRSRTLAGQARQQFEAVARLAPVRKGEIELARQEEQDRLRREEEARMDATARSRAIRQSLQELDGRAADALDQVESQRLAPRLQAQSEELERRRLEAAELSSDATPDQLAAARDRLDTALKGLRQGISAELAAAATTTGPPPELLAAARAYFQADYDRAARLLTDVAFSDERATAQAHLFRAAARYALFLVGGEADESLRDGSESEIQALQTLDPELAPDTTRFSPRFARFFTQVVASL